MTAEQIPFHATITPRPIVLRPRRHRVKSSPLVRLFLQNDNHHRSGVASPRNPSGQGPLKRATRGKGDSRRRGLFGTVWMCFVSLRCCIFSSGFVLQSCLDEPGVCVYRGLLLPCLGPEEPHYMLIFHCIASPKAAKQEERGGNFLFAIESSGKHLAGKIWKGERNWLRDLKTVLSCSNFFI